MPRPPSVWFRKSTGWYMTTVAGVQHKLSRDKAEARRLFYQLMGGPPPKESRSGLTARRLLDAYLVRTRDRVGDDRHAVRVGHCKAFATKFGHREPLTLKPHEVNGWLDGPEAPVAGWGGSTKALHVTTLKAAFNWATGEGLLPHNPLAGLKRRAVAKRRRVLTAEERRRILAEVSPQFRDYLSVLDATGCRPAEAAALTAGGIDWEKGRAVPEHHKNARKGKARTIYFPPPVLARLAELAGDRPTGPLLRNRQHRPWTRSNVADYFRRVCRELGIAGATPYALRHTRISEHLAKGTPLSVVAALSGNSPQVILSTYDQVDKMHDVLRAAADAA